MKVYLRAVNKSKWLDRLNRYKDDKVIGAHPVVADLKADENDILSVWEVDKSDVKTIEDIVLTLVNSRQSKGNIDIVFIPQDKVKEKGINMISVQPKEHLCNCGDRHFDLINLSIDNLQDLSEIIFDILSLDEDAIIRYRKQQITNLFIDRITKKELVIDDILNDFRADVEKYLTD